MKLRVVSVVVPFIFICYSAIALDSSEYILEYDDVQNFSTQESSGSDGLVLTISGLSMHSSLGIKNVLEIRDDDKIQLKVILVEVKGDLNGNLDYKLNVDDSINHVSFGVHKKLIWDRKN